MLGIAQLRGGFHSNVSYPDDSRTRVADKGLGTGLALALQKKNPVHPLGDPT